MDYLERIELILSLENKNRKYLGENTDIGYNRWTTVMNKRGRLSVEELEAVANIWPEYEVWLFTGREFPESGQISPMTKKAHEASKTPQKAG